MASENLPEKSRSDILFYQTPEGSRIEVHLENQTVWLSQAQMAELFQTTSQNITTHIKSICEEGELSEESTCKEYLQVRQEGSRQVQRALKHYNLDMIIAVGYRVRSPRGTQFRQWATQRLREYIIKGFVLDDQRLKDGKTFGADYFDELLERIRDIRASERLFYQKITDIYAKCSIDYDPNSEITEKFYATVQNKLHWAIHRHTAAELIVERADADKPNMGLTAWKQGPKGSIRRNDIHIAKNYLNEDELRQLNRIVTMYLDYAELQAENRRPMYMANWVQKLDAFLQFNDRAILHDAGKVSAEVARQLADEQFEKFQAHRRELEASQPTSDFDHAVEEVKRLETDKKPKNKGDGK